MGDLLHRAVVSHTCVEHLNAAVTRHWDLIQFTFEDFRITGYDPDPHIKAEVAV